MTQNKKLRLASLFSYLGHFIIGLALVLVCFISAVTADTEGWEAIGAAILLVFALLLGIYTVVLLLPLLFSVLAFRYEKRGWTVACLVFDGLYILLDLVYFLSLVTGGDGAWVLPAAALLLPLTTLVLNILVLKNKPTPTGESEQ